MKNTLLIPKRTSNNQYWDTLHGCSLSLALSEYTLQTAGIKLIIAPDNLSVYQLKEEIAFFQGSAREILIFPDWETLPYDHFSPHQDIISQRLHTLSRLQHSPNAIIITAISTIMHRLPLPLFLNQHGFVLEIGQSLDIDRFRRQLQHAGYYAVNKVMEHGEYAVRGAIVDVFPMGSTLPFRLELFDECIETLRHFDPESQKTIEKISNIHILPAKEFPLTEESITFFRRTFREHFNGNPSLCSIYETISEKRFPSGIEYYLPLFFEKTATLFDYLEKDTEILTVGAVHEQAESFWQEVNKRYESHRYDVNKPILPPNVVFLDPNETLSACNQYPQTRLSNTTTTKKGAIHFNIEASASFPIERHAKAPLEKLALHLANASMKSLIVVESAGRREMILDLLKQSNCTAKIQATWDSFLSDTSPTLQHITVGPLLAGSLLNDAHIEIIVESQLFGEQSTPQHKSTQKSIDPDLIIKDLAELQMNAPVVHIQHGIGRYQGLQIIDNEGEPNEFLVLAYAGSDKIYVPITALHLINRYSGADAASAPLHKLGSDQWQKEKKKAYEKIHDVAIELLDVYAKREAKPGHQYVLDKVEYQRFASGFPFTETPDQIQAVEQIFADMQSERAMDRLICGDVGFGKTEVAMRTAHLAVQNNKQVCVLVPTTLLANQHFETFRDRFADFPIHIDLLSRFRTSKESDTVVEALAAGKVDIIIGTHKLFQKNIKFKSLGLLIIDEEHRFGVKQKEHIKALRNEVDILSMTATPIPRTLNMAMGGLRDISLIATPPAKRLSIKTFWQVRNDTLLREAMLREILRGGQVFFLHNNVQTIHQIKTELESLVPEAKIQVAHGQMRERELERIMSDFYHHRFNVLVCTTIIETGIDIPTANTIIIDRADKFGLAQLHQLRGRVGRSHHQAYAYLLTPEESVLTSDAKKRLEAIVSLEDLGAGFALASHDLEIRGAGELLGEEQSGNMHAIGFSLYMELLEKAVNDLKSGKHIELEGPLRKGTEIELRMSAIIPEAYIGDIHTRLIQYKRIANAKDLQALHELQVETIDRFGLMPKEVKRLFLITELKLLATPMGILRIQAGKEMGKIEFSDHPAINPATLIQLIQKEPKIYQLQGPTVLKFHFKMKNADEMIEEIMDLIKLIGIEK